MNQQNLMKQIESRKRVTASEMALDFHIPYNTAARRLRKMRHAGLVDCKKGVWFKARKDRSIV